LHRGYLTSLAVVALQDQVLTAAERRDLDAVAGLLGLTTGDVDRSLAEADGAAAPAREQWRLSAGDLVVFTGSMTPAREVWEETARRHGLDVGGNVTKKTRLLVAADPDTMSGKAKKAHQYGIPIVHPTAYRTMLDEMPVATGV
jgi:DNA polymerase-3 subunit epsilon